MSCCGNKRANLYGTVSLQLAANGAQPSMNVQPVPRTSPPVAVVFEYTGESGVSVLGPVTRRMYRFDGKHWRVSVDARDAPAVAGVPKLQRVA